MTCYLCDRPITTEHQAIHHGGGVYPVCPECFPGQPSAGAAYTTVSSLGALEQLHWAVAAKRLAEKEKDAA